MAPSRGMLMPVMLRRGVCLYQVTPSRSARLSPQRNGFLLASVRLHQSCQLSSGHEQAPSWPAYPYLAGSLPAFFLFVYGCPALNTAAVRLLC
jgi:hypothetical protein